MEVSDGMDEAAVLTWLITKPGVAQAVDLALAGRSAEAVQVLIKAVRSILAEGEPVTGQQDASAKCTADADAPVSSSPFDAAESPIVPNALAAAEVCAGVPSSPGKKSQLVESSLSSSKRLRVSSTGLARCICIVVSGLHGCGKSSLCNALREVLGGTWLNSDEVASKCKAGENVRQAFSGRLRAVLMQGLAASENNRHDRIVFIDRPNILRSHRLEILQTLRKLRWRMRGGTVLFVDFVHASDSFGYGTDGQLSKRFGEEYVAICRSRVESRGDAQYSGGVRPSPKLRALLQGASRTAEAPSAEELMEFDSRLSIDIMLSLPEMASLVIEELRRLGWMPSLRGPDELMKRIEVAWLAYQRAESQWREGAKATEEHSEWLTQCRQALEIERAQERERARKAEQASQSGALPTESSVNGESVALYWKLDLPEVSKVLSARGILPPTFVPTESPHTTLLYLGGAEDALVARRAGVPSDQVQTMREALEALEGEVFECKMTEIVIEENVACAVISLPPVLPCLNKVPHVTLGTKRGVSARYANEVLDELRAGRREGVTTLPLPTPRALKGRVQLQRGCPSASREGIGC